MKLTSLGIYAALLIRIDGSFSAIKNIVYLGLLKLQHCPRYLALRRPYGKCENPGIYHVV